MAQDYKTRLTADTSQHDAALKKSAQQVYQYKKRTEETKQTIGKLVGSVGKFAAGLGIATSSLQIATKAIRGTEQGADAMDRTIHTAKSTVDRFFQSISSGSFNAFTDGLHEITKAAREAYNALDDLGTMKMWNNLDIEKQRTIIAKNKTIIYDGNATAAQKKAAQQAIDNAIAEIERLNGQLIDQSNKASQALLREYAGSTRVTTATLEKYRKMLKEGTLGQYAANWKAKNSYETYEYVTMDANAPASKMYYTKWNDKNAELLYNVMQSYLTLPEEKWQALIDIEAQNEQRMQQLEQMKQQAARTANRVDGNGGTKTPKVTIQTEVEPLPEGSIAELESQLAELRKSYSLAPTDEERNNLRQQIATMQTELDRMNGKNEVEIAPVIPEGSIAYLQQKIRELTEQMENTPDAELRIKLIADISDVQNQLKEMQTTDAERAAEALRKKYEEVQKQTEATASAFNQIGSVFSSLGDCMDDEGKRFMQVVGTVFSGISTLIPQIAALTATEEAEAMAAGTASAAKLPFPYNLASIASVVATLVGVFASISSIAQSGYADGGIIQGKTTVGDWNLARVNGGEMILNSTQQSRLFKMLNNPIVSTQSTDGGNVTFTIHGSDLMGTLNNYNKKRNRVI